MKRRIHRYLTTKWPALIWSVIIFLLLAIPPVNLGAEKTIEFSGLDKLIHFCLFGIMAWLWAYRQQPIAQARRTHQQQLLLIVTLTTVYGIVMEYVQRWVGRDFDVWDMVADAAGAMVACLWFLLQKRRPW